MVRVMIEVSGNTFSVNVFSSKCSIIPIFLPSCAPVLAIFASFQSVTLHYITNVTLQTLKRYITNIQNKYLFYIIKNSPWPGMG